MNGIRAVERKGELESFLSSQSPDVLLIQETKATPDKLSKNLLENQDYVSFYHSAEKAGYSGTSIWVSRKIETELSWLPGLPGYEDNEGRVARIDFAGLSILGVYFPNGGKSADAWDDKLVFYRCFLDYVNQLRLDGRKVVWAGDVNCAHEEIDIARPKENKKSIGFLPEERAWVTDVIENSWDDVYRKKYPDSVIYSWWHLISKARARNVGWRIDYFFVNEGFVDQVEDADIHDDIMGSDHCPVSLTLKGEGI